MGQEQREQELRFITIKEAGHIAGLSRSSILRRIKTKRFPEPALRERRAVRFVLSEVLQWCEARIRERDERAAA